MVALHSGQVAQLPLLVQLGVAQQNQVVLLIQFAGDAGGDLPHRLGTDAGGNDPDLVHPAGAQSLGGGVRAVACFFHHFPDASRFCSLSGPPLRYRLTAALDTPAIFAMSLMVMGQVPLTRSASRRL